MTADEHRFRFLALGERTKVRGKPQREDKNIQPQRHGGHRDAESTEKNYLEDAKKC